jgi:hypothetical protein
MPTLGTGPLAIPIPKSVRESEQDTGRTREGGELAFFPVFACLACMVLYWAVNSSNRLDRFWRKGDLSEERKKRKKERGE